MSGPSTPSKTSAPEAMDIVEPSSLLADDVQILAIQPPPPPPPDPFKTLKAYYEETLGPVAGGLIAQLQAKHASKFRIPFHQMSFHHMCFHHIPFHHITFAHISFAHMCFQHIPFHHILFAHIPFAHIPLLRNAHSNRNPEEMAEALSQHTQSDYLTLKKKFESVKEKAREWKNCSRDLKFENTQLKKELAGWKLLQGRIAEYIPVSIQLSLQN